MNDHLLVNHPPNELPIAKFIPYIRLILLSKIKINNAKRVKNWIDKYGRDEVKGMTEVGLARMNQLIAREKLSLSTLKRTFSFLSRTKGGGFNKINPDYSDTPWRDKGYVAYLGWGGEAMLKYAERKLQQLEYE